MSSASPKLERISVGVAWLLCAVILWSFFGGGHQLFVPHRTTFEDFDPVNAFMWFCPAFVLLIFRRYWFVVAAYAVPILVLLVARIYFFWRLEALGTNVVDEYAYWVLGPQYLLMVFSFLVLICWIVEVCFFILEIFAWRKVMASITIVVGAGLPGHATIQINRGEKTTYLGLGKFRAWAACVGR